jgi:hypothetical protein
MESSNHHQHGPVHDGIAAPGGSEHRGGVAHVALHHLRAGYLDGSTLQADHVVAALHQRAGDPGEQHAAGPRDEHLHQRPPASTRSMVAASAVRSILALWRMSTGSRSATHTAATPA